MVVGLYRIYSFIDSKVLSLKHTGHTYSSSSVSDIRVSKQNFEDAYNKVHPSVSKKVRKYKPGCPQVPLFDFQLISALPSSNYLDQVF